MSSDDTATTAHAGPDLPGDAEVAAELARTLPGRRYFADKAAAVTEVELRHREPVAAAGGRPVELIFARVHVGDAAPGYLLPVVWTPAAAAPESDVLVAAGELAGVDALADAEAVTALGAALIGGGRLGAMELRRVPGAAEPAVPAAGRAMGVEQSNTSAILDEAVLCKFFRRLHPGVNADVELLTALSAADCAAVPPLLAWTELVVDGEAYTTAMLQEYVPNSADGWAMALISVRDIIREGDLQPADLGTDFAAEARALGAAVARVHLTLAAALPAGAPLTGAELIAPMLTRLEQVAATVPEVAACADRARAVYRRAAAAVPAAGAPVQRIHGDLHLGQVLRTPREWLLIDFEGEPSRPWDERRLPDHRLRDIAGMVRSFDYAAHFPLLSGREDSPQHRYRVAEWAGRNIGAFLDGYAAEAGADPRAEAALLDAFTLDKAVYECLYEAQNRPDWLALPLAAVHRLLDGAEGADPGPAAGR